MKDHRVEVIKEIKELRKACKDGVFTDEGVFNATKWIVRLIEDYEIEYSELT